MRTFAIIGYFENKDLIRELKIYKATDNIYESLPETLDENNLIARENLSNLLSARFLKTYEVVKVLEMQNGANEICLNIENLAPCVNYKDS